MGSSSVEKAQEPQAMTLSKKTTKKRERDEDREEAKINKQKSSTEDEETKVEKLTNRESSTDESNDNNDEQEDVQPDNTGKSPEGISSKLKPKEEVPSDDPSTTTTTTTKTYDLQYLEKEYQDALKAYKADKTNKDLRRAKTAAKRAWDAALIATSEPGAEPFTCRNCSQLFLFTAHDRFEDRGWDKPTQCKDCTSKISISRANDRSRRDQKQNMCYEFQKTGKCSRGDRCKFSHAKDHVGKTRRTRRPICFAFEKGETCPHGDRCRFRHEKD